MRLCIPGDKRAIGGPLRFQERLTRGLERHGVGVTSQLKDEPFQAVLVIGGSRDLVSLQRLKRKKGVRIVQRLAQRNWMHRVRPGSPRQFLKAELRNYVTSFIRRRLADHVVYQSRFVEQYWESTGTPSPVPYQVIPNGVDLAHFTPEESGLQAERDKWRVLLVEGQLFNQQADSVWWAKEACVMARKATGQPITLLVVAAQLAANARAALDSVEWCSSAGPLTDHEMAATYQTGACVISGDINAGCPNVVLEALASGVPVVGFATGALPELLLGGAGICVPYGADPWRLEPPDIGALAAGLIEVLTNGETYRNAARQVAEERYGEERMVEAYLQVLFPGFD